MSYRIVITTIAVAVAIACALGLYIRWSGSGTQLDVYLNQRQDYLVFIGYPLDAPAKWRKVLRYDREIVCIEGEEIPVADISSYVVAYPNGEILNWENALDPFPDGLLRPKEVAQRVEDVLDLKALSRDEKFIRISFGKSDSRPNDPNCYSTALRNVSNTKIRVLKFGGYRRAGEQYILHTVTGDYFTAEQFQAWYAVDQDGWIKPGQEVSDPNNYGGRDSMWAFFCMKADGEQFVVGASPEDY